MDKLAQLKSAEVAGVISGLIDGGYLKLASDQEFEALTDVVAGSISDNWDLNEVLNKTAEVMDYVAQEDGVVEKTAEEQTHDLLAEYGYLCLAKEAGELSGKEFSKEAAKYHKWLADGASAYASAAKDAIKRVSKTFGRKLTFTDLRNMRGANKEMAAIAQPYSSEAMKKAFGDSAKAWGGVGAAGLTGVAGYEAIKNRKKVKDAANDAKDYTKSILNKLRKSVD